MNTRPRGKWIRYKKPTYQEVFDLACEKFMHDRDRTIAWWMGRIPELNNKSPFEMVRDGKGNEIINIIMG